MRAFFCSSHVCHPSLNPSEFSCYYFEQRWMEQHFPSHTICRKAGQGWPELWSSSREVSRVTPGMNVLLFSLVSGQIQFPCCCSGYKKKNPQVIDNSSACSWSLVKHTMAATEVIPPILLCWPMTSEADVGGTAREAEPSHQYSIPCCCHVTDGSRGAVWHNGVWHGSVYEGKVCHWIPPYGKNCTHWHSSTLDERDGDRTVAVSAVRQWVVRFSSDSGALLMVQIFCKWGVMQALVHRWQKCTSNGDDYVEE